MRKITFGNRSLHGNGQRNHEVLMSLIQTARQLNQSLNFPASAPYRARCRTRRTPARSRFNPLNYC